MLNLQTFQGSYSEESGNGFKINLENKLNFANDNVMV